MAPCMAHSSAALRQLRRAAALHHHRMDGSSAQVTGDRPEALTLPDIHMYTNYLCGAGVLAGRSRLPRRPRLPGLCTQGKKRKVQGGTVHKAAEGARSEPRWGFARLTLFTPRSSAFTLQLSAAGLREAHALIVGGAAAACGARAHPGEYLQVAN
jgi:hypothetical protein